MKKWFLFFGTALAISFYSCSKDDDGPQRVNPQDVAFVYKAASANAAEIVLGQLAADSSQTPEIQAYGQKMVSEHSAADAELKSIASQLGITAPDTMDANHQAIRMQLLNLKDRSFDSLYIHTMVNDHANALLLFETGHDLGNNRTLKAYSVEMLPALQAHYQEAQAIAAGY